LQSEYLLTLLRPDSNTIGNRVSQQVLHGIFFHPVQLQVAVSLVSFQAPLAFQVCGYPQTDLVDQLAQFILLQGFGSIEGDFAVIAIRKELQILLFM
jgi:hypothetical protein